MTPEEFRRELSRLHADAVTQGLCSEDLMAAAKCSQRTLERWIGGYACPATPKARQSVIMAVSRDIFGVQAG